LLIFDFACRLPFEVDRFQTQTIRFNDALALCLHGVPEDCVADSAIQN
jgi:hypothetical protein